MRWSHTQSLHFQGGEGSLFSLNSDRNSPKPENRRLADGDGASGHVTLGALSLISQISRDTHKVSAPLPDPQPLPPHRSSKPPGHILLLLLIVFLPTHFLSVPSIWQQQMARKSKPFHIFASTLQFFKGLTLERAWEPKPELGPSRWARAAHVSASWCREGLWLRLGMWLGFAAGNWAALGILSLFWASFLACKNGANQNNCLRPLWWKCLSTPHILPSLQVQQLGSLLSFTYLAIFHLYLWWLTGYFSDTQAFPFLHLGRSPGGPPFVLFQNLKHWQQMWTGSREESGPRVRWWLQKAFNSFQQEQETSWQIVSSAPPPYLWLCRRFSEMSTWQDEKGGENGSHKMRGKVGSGWVGTCVFVSVCLSWRDSEQHGYYYRCPDTIMHQKTHVRAGAIFMTLLI